MNDILIWLEQNTMLLLPLLAAAVAIWWLLPRLRYRRRPLLASLLGIAALVGVGMTWLHPTGETAHDIPFYLIAATAVGSAALMITDRDPVHAALWFALTTLAVCGLFLLRSASFLAAATVIVYAGAIIVVFLFVIMLARQSGGARYDQQAAQPLAGVLVVTLLLATNLVILQVWQPPQPVTSEEVAVVTGVGAEVAGVEVTARAPVFLPPPAELKANVLSGSDEEAGFGNLNGLGRSLFSDYLFAVEVAGTLLVVTAVGAIAIAPRTRRGTL